METFGQRLKAARKAAQLTSNQAAMRIREPQPNYSAWENDRRTPAPHRQEEILALLAAPNVPARIIAVVEQFQSEMADSARRFAAKLLATADADQFASMADLFKSISDFHPSFTSEAEKAAYLQNARERFASELPADAIDPAVADVVDEHKEILAKATAKKEPRLKLESPKPAGRQRAK